MMRKTLIWLVAILALVAYMLVVYGWWVEGNHRPPAKIELEQ